MNDQKAWDAYAGGKERNGVRDFKRRRLIKRIKRSIRLAVLVGLIALGIVYWGPLSRLLSSLLLGVDYQASAQLISHQLEEVGELVTLRAIDNGVLNGELKAKFLGTVSQVTVPYQYEIGMGIKLEDVVLTPGENDLTVSVPPAQVLYDSFQVTGEPETKDILRQASQARYQKLQNAQHEECRQQYLSDQESMQSAWKSACDQLRALFSQWTGKALNLRFEMGNSSGK